MNFKRFLALFLAILMAILALTGCEKTYKEARSSREMRRTVARIGDYEVNYEFFRYLFLSFKPGVDGGDDSVWTGPDADEYFKVCKEKCEEVMRAVYGTFIFAKNAGIDPYSKEADARVDELVKATIEGGFINGNYVQGYGSVKKYREDLEANHMTDAVNRLFFRYSICESMLYEYYTDTFGGGTIQTDDQTIRNFFAQEDLIRMTWIAVQKDGTFTDAQYRTLANERREGLLACSSLDEKLQYVAFHNLQAATMDKGVFLTASTCGAEYKTVYEEAKSLSAGEVGDIIETADAFYIPLRLQKPSDYLNTANGMTEIVNLYIEHSLYSTLDSQNEALTISYTSGFSRYADAFGSNIK